MTEEEKIQLISAAIAIGFEELKREGKEIYYIATVDRICDLCALVARATMDQMENLK